MRSVRRAALAVAAAWVALAFSACTSDEPVSPAPADDAALRQLAVAATEDSLRVLYQPCTGERIEEVRVVEALFGSTIRWDLEREASSAAARTFVAQRPRGLEDDGPPPARARLSVNVDTSKHEVEVAAVTIEELLQLPEDSVFVGNAEVKDLDSFVDGAGAAC